MSAKENSTSGEDQKETNKLTGVRISPVTGFVLAFLAVAIAVGVGLIVHFVEKTPEVKCVCSVPNGSAVSTGTNMLYSLQQCKEKAKDPNSGICGSNKKGNSNAQLPKTVKPLHYDLEVRPNMYDDDPTTFTFTGYVKITMKCLQATSDVTMHAKNLDITSGSITFWTNDTSGNGPEYVSHEVDGENELLKIHLSEKMDVDRFYFIKLNFTGPLTDDLDGFYLSSYKRANRTVYLAATQFESTTARKAFPCFDEPALKARFHITVVRKKELSSLSNMKIDRTESRDSGFEADIYQTTPIMSTYLVAFIVCDFKHINGTTKRGLEYRVWAPKEQISLLYYALSVGERTISYYEDYFQIQFPLPKQDMVALPDFAAGAQENWGCITYRTDRLLYEDGVTSTTTQRSVLIDITHELAHQWFGDLVTMEWWDDIWLNEGFATFFSYQGAEEVEPGWDMYNEFVIEEILPVFEIDGYVTSHPIYNTDQSQSQVFDSISYSKGGSILRMLKFFIGDDTFRKGLSRYLRSRAYGNAKHDDLWNALHQQTEEDDKTIDVVDTMRTWTLQMNYPVVTVSRVGDKQLKLTQSRFLFDSESDDPGTYKSAYNYKWNIPFTFTTSDDPNFNVTDTDIVWIQRNGDKDVYDVTLPVSDPQDGSSWILGNIRHHGFYRVNYDEDNWKNIIKQLKQNHEAIIPINRAQIINDAIDLARADMLDLRLALGTVEYLSSELNYYPWKTALGKLDYIDKMLRNTDLYGAFKSFIKASINNVFKHYGLQDPGTDHVESLARREVATAACGYAISDCLRDARDVFLAWKHNPSVNSIFPELLKTVLCVGLSEGNSDDWYFVYDMYKAETSASVKMDMMKSLACPQEPWLMELYLHKAITPSEIRRGDALQALSSGPTLNPRLQPLLWNFIRENYHLLRDDFATNIYYFNKMVIAATDTLNTEFQLQELESFINSTGPLGEGESPFKRAVSATKDNIKWMKTNYPVLKRWLTDLGYYDEHNANQVSSKTNDAIFLPKTVKPIHYDLEMKPNMYEGQPSDYTFEGQIRITIDCLEPTSDVTLHVRKINITSGSVQLGSDDSEPEEIHYVSHDVNPNNDFLTIHASRKLTQGRRYFLKMNFVGPLKDDLAGLYLSTYKKGNTTANIAITDFEPSDARKAFPCFDEPGWKANFSITLVRRNDFKSTSNMHISKTEDRGNGFSADVYHTTPPMSTYLVAFVVFDFGYIEGNTTRGTKFRVWARKDFLDQLQYALDVGTKTLSYYEKYFKLDFPLPKQDMIAIPDFSSGAMENWGMITYREQRLFYKPGVTNNYAKQMVTVDVTHELGHMWFGDLVTPKWWDDLWLNEGFATWLEYMGADLIEPTFDMNEQFVVDEMLPVFKEDALVTSHPINVHVETVAEIEEIFDVISYNKGGTVLRMLRFFIGEETFKNGLARYLRNNMYSNADHDDLWAALDMQALQENKSVDVGDTMRTWTLQMNYPVVTVSRVGDRHLRLTQERFLLDPSSSDQEKYESAYNYKWNIPFTFTTSTEKNFQKTDSDITWIMKNAKSDLHTTTISIPDYGDQSSWIVGNIGLYGLYRIQYEDDNWSALTKQLNTDHTVIHKLNRAQIINDAWDLAKSGRLSQDIALKTVDYLDRETDYYPWIAAIEKLNYVGTMLQDTELYGRYQKFVQQKSGQAFLKVGINDTGATQIESFARREIVGAACSASTPECVKEAVDIFQRWKQNDTKYPIYPELRKPILCTGLSEGTPDDWFFVFNKYKTEKELAIKDDILVSLGCTSHEWVIHTLLQKAITPSEIRRQDTTRVLFYTTNNARGQSIVWNFIKDNWALLRDEYSKTFSFVAKMIIGSTRGFNTPARLQEIENFVSSTPNLGNGERAFHQAIEETKANIRWMDKNFPTVKKWLEGEHNTDQVIQSEEVFLPKTVKPIHYDLELKPNMYEGDPADYTFEGQVRVTFQCLEPTSDVTLHMKKLELTPGSIQLGSNDSESKDISYVSHSFNPVNEFLTIHASRKLTQNRRYFLKMNFKGPLKDDLAGFYLSSYKKGNKTAYLATSHFEPSDARKAFPCFDEPEMKAKFSITLVRRRDFKSTSNMPILRTEDRSNGFQADVYQTSPIMSTYLVAFVIFDFGYIEGNTSKGLKFRVWAREDYHDQLQYALDVGTRVLTYYEDYFKLDFPLPKQDMVAIPDFAMGAMENWGMITYREQRLFYKPGVTDNFAKQMVTVDVTHELAHQWFGNLVTPKWWDDLWLNEGFATFVEYMGAELVEPTFHMFEQFTVEEMLPIFTEDAMATSHPIYVPVKTVDEVEETFDDISYNKGGTVLRMLRFFIGEETFRNGLAQYLKNNIYSNADHDDLWEALDQQAKLEKKNVDVGDTMRTWTLQMNYPVVKVSRVGDRQLKLTQERFLLDPKASDPGIYKSQYHYKWNIPFVFTTSSEKNFSKTDSDIVWMMRNDKTDVYSTSISIPDAADSWIVGNIGLYGLYRVHYDEENWLALIKKLNTDHTALNRVTRAQIINDAWDLAKSGRLRQDIALKTVDYLDRETDYYPWITAVEKLKYVGTMLQNTELHGRFQKFMREKSSKAFMKVGINDTGAAQLDSFARREIVGAACGASSSECVKKAVEIFQKWKQNNTAYPMYPELRKPILCTGMSEGSPEDWFYVFNKYKTESEISIKDDILVSLGCSSDEWIIHTLLNKAITPSEIRRADTTRVLYFTTENARAQPIVWDFIKANWPLLRDEFSSTFNYVAKMIIGSTRGFNTAAKLKEIEDFVSSTPDLGNGERAFQQAIEQTKANIRWMDKNYSAVKEWLQSMSFTE